MEKIEGIVEDVIYRNEENGYTVLNVVIKEEELTVVGLMFEVSTGEHITAEGEYTAHNVYGKQFKASHIETYMPTEVEAIIRYLGSGAVKGIGEKLAERIVEAFGEDTFHIIENDPLKLAEVKGISERKAQDIGTVFIEQRSMRQVVIFLQNYRLSLTYAIKIYQQYKEKTYDIIKSNPYLLAEDINGISFRMADEIAEQIGVAKDSEFRIMAAVKHVLLQSTMEGHTFLDYDIVESRTIDLLMVPIDDLSDIFLQLQIKGAIVIEEIKGVRRVFLTTMDMMEKTISAKLFELTHVRQDRSSLTDQEKKNVQDNMGIELDENQIEAISQSLTQGTLIITGGPGTGKTTTLNAIINVLKDEHQVVLLAAPTGRAAKRMSEATGEEAKTIHRLLEISGGMEGSQKFERNEDYPLECDVVIIDEISMIDTSLMYHLLKAIAPGTRLIFVGDQDQLPSVGPGNILKDMIHSGYIPTVKLKRIFRQAEESQIVMNAHRINQGQMPDLKNNQKDFFFVRRYEGEQILSELITLVRDRLPKFAKVDPLDGIQILTPTRKGTLGVDRLNEVLQEVLNPPKKDKTEKEYRQRIYREGDKVMQIKNNYTLPWLIISKYGYKVDEGVGVFNGDMGRITEINHYTEKVKVLFDDDRQVFYDFKGLDELEHAYAVTIHKSQGSEYPVVVLPVFRGPTMLQNRNLLYTGITRAKQYVVMVGDDQVVRQMVDNNKETERNSALAIRIMEMFSVL